MDRRRYKRVISHFHVWYQTIGDMKEQPLCLNISEGGALLRLHKEESVGMNVVLKFNIPTHNEKLEINGKVVWVKKLDIENYNVGIEFREIDKKEKEIIKGFVEKQLKK